MTLPVEIDLRKALRGPAGDMRLHVRATLAGGSFASLFGPSGAGKTTLLRMLAGLTQPDAGRLVIGGETWFDGEKGIDLPPQRRAIGYVFQDHALFPNLTVRENIAYGADRRDAGWVDELTEMIGLAELRQRRPDTLSGGQRQRVALARALARKPALLLLDEPLSALDAGLRSRLQDDLARLHAQLGLTTLMVTHDLGEVFKLSSEVLCLEDGRIARSGAPDAVFLRRRGAGELTLQGQVLAVRREEVVFVVALLIGQDIIEVLASEDEVADLAPGDAVFVGARTFSPMLRKRR
ncbi:molybdate transport system ATP-binding protein [Noviherbaspirillum humi]|uniref:Molybdate transport system ATP-binding protein n=1 Tax=Noviherbaspirillum humi TaxID=1688639 RepID=A0A239EAP3_9BURK|nr:ATP-binding cassette domain-containing protein [Noviherbaspirillum humi]SNS41541.1 molybdate transport system ATP-binding protein [Noviherbaspirillum humi]